jgi:hypothetical protein
VPSTSTTPPVGQETEQSRQRAAADAIVQLLSPATVLASGSARASVVDALRHRGVDVDEVDLVSGPRAAGSETPSRTYDLVVHVGTSAGPIEDGEQLVAALSASATVLFCADGPGPSGDPGDDDVDDAAYWARLFAEHGLFRDLDHDAGYLASGAVLFRRSGHAVADLVQRYEQALRDLRAHTDAEIARLEGEHRQLRKEILRTRDLSFGRQAELASALARVELLESAMARYDNLEQRLHDVLNSRSWRVTQTIGLPVRLLRQRR